MKHTLSVVILAIVALWVGSFVRPAAILKWGRIFAVGAGDLVVIQTVDMPAREYERIDGTTFIGWEFFDRIREATIVHDDAIVVPLWVPLIVIVPSWMVVRRRSRHLGSRMPTNRPILRALSKLSVVMFAFALALWTFSVFFQARYFGGRAGKSWNLNAGDGAVSASYESRTGIVDIIGTATPILPEEGVTPASWHSGGFSWQSDLGFAQPSCEFHYLGEGNHDWSLYLPMWVPTILSLLFIVVLRGPIYVQDRRMRRLRCDGRCLHCGYDLQGNTTGVCPECGSLADRASCGRRPLVE